jgi:hypothetical protein
MWYIILTKNMNCINVEYAGTRISVIRSLLQYLVVPKKSTYIFVEEGSNILIF